MRTLCGLAFGLVMLASLPAAADSVQDVVFDAHLLADVDRPETLIYDYDMRGTLMPKAYHSNVRMEVREVRADGGKLVHFDMFEGPRRRQLGPVHAKQQNPLVLVFLQRDVYLMGRMTGGTPGYFQKRIREAFTRPAEVEHLEVELDGRRLPAVRVSIEPFAADPQIARFPQFRYKRYEFTVAEGVPGGLYRIAALTPKGKDGEVLLEEGVTFAALREREGATNP
ncbi:MAG: hypothetical protein ACREH6_05790 [Geminicoccaceae bacterium]